MMYRWFVMLLVLLCTVVGCSSDDNSDPVPDERSPVPIPTVGLNARLEREAQLAQLAEAQAQLEQIWRDLQAGQSVSCATEILARPSPILFEDGTDILSSWLYQAALAIEESVQTWQLECSNPRAQPPADVIDRGLTTALEAQTALQAAQTALTSPESLPED